MGNSFRQTVAGIFSDARMNEQVMLSSHVIATAERAEATEGGYLIACQDTTFYNHTGHKQMEGPGRLQGGILGILQHNVLLTSDKGVPLGLIDQQHWSRQSAAAFDGRESLKWERGLRAVNDRLAATGKKVVVVQDREAGIFSFFKHPREPDIELLVRVHQPRNLEVAGSGEVSKLAGLRETVPPAGQKQVSISGDGKEVTLTLSVQAGKVHVLPDKGRSAGKHKTQELSLVIARETAAKDSKGNDVFDADKAALRYLLTSLPIGSQQDMERVVTFYGLRWRVERLGFTVKSGAPNVEGLQFDDVQTTINALSFYSVVAWQPLAMTYVFRENQEAPAQAVFEQNEVRLLEKIDKKPIKTVKDAVLALAKIAGFAKSKRQPLPGVKVLAQAFERFHYIKLGNIIDH